MKTRIVPLILSSTSILLLTSALFTALPMVYASTSTTVSGTFTSGGSELLSVRVADGNTILKLNATDIISGGITGTCVDNIIPLTLMIHAGGLSGNIHGKCLGRATILGRTGTYVKSFSANFTVNGVVGHATLDHGTGGLAGIHGQESDFSADGNTFTYSAQIHFDPS